ncbi:MAG: SDR family oxidoreductase, partial [Acetobacteraceae bacterium]|nr:SDR family oxidoreductase [Acetobacteraceae bacterium]
ARVAIAEINPATGEETAQRVTAAGGEAIAIPTDVREEDSLRVAIRTTVQHFGGLHVLHNNAGGSTLDDGTVIDAPMEEFWRCMKLDVLGTFLGCRFGIPEIIRSGGGAVVNMTSVVALMGIAGRDCYTAAKGAVAALTRSLAVEFAEQRVRVNALAPSVTMTERVKRLLAGNSALAALERDHMLGLIQPEEMARSVLYLASDLSSKVTGQIIPVDSGVTVR